VEKLLSLLKSLLHNTVTRSASRTSLAWRPAVRRGWAPQRVSLWEQWERSQHRKIQSSSCCSSTVSQKSGSKQIIHIILT